MMRDSHVRRHVPRRALLVVAVVVALAGASSAWATGAAPPTVGIKFVMQFRGSFEGSWHNSLTLPPSSNQFECEGNDESGTLTSSVSPSGPSTITVAREFGRTLYIDLGKSQRWPKGTIHYKASAQGWLLKYTGGQCVRQPLEVGPCTEQSFVEQISIQGGSGLHRTVEPAYLYWPLGPPDMVTDCLTGTMWTGVASPQEGAATKLDLSKLFKCGIRKPRGCRFTIGGAKEYAYSETPSTGQTYTGSGAISWSITFVAVGKVTP